MKISYEMNQMVLVTYRSETIDMITLIWLMHVNNLCVIYRYLFYKKNSELKIIKSCLLPLLEWISSLWLISYHLSKAGQPPWPLVEELRAGDRAVARLHQLTMADCADMTCSHAVALSVPDESCCFYIHRMDNKDTGKPLLQRYQRGRHNVVMWYGIMLEEDMECVH